MLPLAVLATPVGVFRLVALAGGGALGLQGTVFRSGWPSTTLALIAVVKGGRNCVTRQLLFSETQRFPDGSMVTSSGLFIVVAVPPLAELVAFGCPRMMLAFWLVENGAL